MKLPPKTISQIRQNLKINGELTGTLQLKQKIEQLCYMLHNAIFNYIMSATEDNKMEIIIDLLNETFNNLEILKEPLMVYYRGEYLGVLAFDEGIEIRKHPILPVLDEHGEIIRCEQKIYLKELMPKICLQDLEHCDRLEKGIIKLA